MGNKKTLSTALISAVVVIILAVIIYYSGVLMPKTLEGGSFETVVAQRGEVISTIQATGIVESENEVFVLSPATSIIKSILKEPGTHVKMGETIIQLNKEPIEDEIEKLKDQLDFKKNNLEKTQLNAQSTKLDLDYNEEVKKLKIKSLESQLADQEQLLEVGGISPARIEQTKQEITLAEKDLNMLVQKNSIRLKQLAADEKGLLLQIRADEKVLKEKYETLAKMDIKAPSSGIILNISGSVGERTTVERMLVRMSDLTSFKLTGAIDEQLANQVKTGMKVLVTVEDEELEGLVGNITPMVENNKVQFNVHLVQSSHPKLIANQNVQIQIISNQKSDALRLPKLEEFEYDKLNKVFVVEGNKAVKRDINFGIIGNEYCEILSGLKEGDAVIKDGINKYRNLDEIEIYN